MACVWFQDIDTDYIKETLCLDQKDGREHVISEVDLNHMYCINPKAANITAGSATFPLASLTIILLTLLSTNLSVL